MPRQSLRHVTFVDLVLLERSRLSCFSSFFLFLLSSLVSWHPSSSLSCMSAFRCLQFPGLATNPNPAPDASQRSTMYQANYAGTHQPEPAFSNQSYQDYYAGTHQPYPEFLNQVHGLENSAFLLFGCITLLMFCSFQQSFATRKDVTNALKLHLAREGREVVH